MDEKFNNFYTGEKPDEDFTIDQNETSDALVKRMIMDIYNKCVKLGENDDEDSKASALFEMTTYILAILSGRHERYKEGFKLIEKLRGIEIDTDYMGLFENILAKKIKGADSVVDETKVED